MNRILQVDFFRGFFLIIIITNHFLSSQNIIFHFTHELIGWITAAEGFVFLSGLTAGIVYSRKLVEKGKDFISLAAKKRAWTIYKYHLILFILVALILIAHPIVKEYWLSNHSEYKFLLEKPVLAALLSSILLYQPSFMDILPMYALFILLLPTTLMSFQKGKHVSILVFSFLVYILGTFDITSKLIQQVQFMKQVHTGGFNLLSWQFLFIVGLYLGFLTYQNKTNSILQNKTLFYSSLLLSIFIFIFKQAYYNSDLFHFHLNYYWISRNGLGPLRLLNFAALLVVMSFLASRFKKVFSFKPICYLGKYSLEVFSFQILLIFIFKPLQDFSNNFHAIKIVNNIYIYPWATFMLLFILIPALFLAPWLKNYINLNKHAAIRQVG